MKVTTRGMLPFLRWKKAKNYLEKIFSNSNENF
jgi:hypothetical protein